MTIRPNAPEHVLVPRSGGTFTEAALEQVPEAAGRHWRSVDNVGEGLADARAALRSRP